ncbi:Unknown protein sequence [Pseudomonas syringae pv. aceris]|nr:Unknown protein sequence [Pseudomonas syringae pv. aceris]
MSLRCKVAKCSPVTMGRGWLIDGRNGVAQGITLKLLQ